MLSLTATVDWSAFLESSLLFATGREDDEGKTGCFDGLEEEGRGQQETESSLAESRCAAPRRARLQRARDKWWDQKKMIDDLKQLEVTGFIDLQSGNKRWR